MVARWAPILILKPAARAVGGIDRKPLFVASKGGAEKRPRLPAREGTPEVGEQIPLQAKVKEIPVGIGEEHRVAAKDARFKHTRERPRHAAVAAVTVTRLA